MVLEAIVAGAVMTWCALAGAGVAGAAGPGAGSPGAAGASWRHAIEVPGLGALNAGGDAFVAGVSCKSAGSCGAGGSYMDGSGHFQAFVVSQRNGRWGKAIEVPGSGALNAGGGAGIASVSCASPGNCAAVGDYREASAHLQTFVVNERNGRWTKAIEVPGSGALNAGGNADIGSVSCASVGNCTAGGLYTDSSGHAQALVVSERNGRWGKAVKVPGSGALNAGGAADITSVSCASAGNCAAGGFYHGASDHLQALLVTQRNGRWGKAIEVPGSRALNAGGSAEIRSVSCPSAGSCAAGGFYTGSSGHVQAFVVSQRNGRWGKAIEVPGSGGLNTGGNALIKSLSCPAAGNCAAGGIYRDSSANREAFVVSQRNGRWDKAIEVPGSGALNAGGGAEVSSVSCPSAGNCAAGGFYLDISGNLQALVVTEQSGHWTKAIEVPGSGALNAGGNGAVNSVSCSSPGKCVAGGRYSDDNDSGQGFVVMRT